MVAIKKDGKWTRVTPASRRSSKKFRTDEEVDLITKKRKYNIPFTIRAQEFDISSWFNLDERQKTWELTDQYKQQYDLIKDDSGKIIGIEKKPQQYITSEKIHYGKSRDRQDISKGSYKPHDIRYRDTGLLSDETKRAIYVTSEGGDDNDWYRQQSPYTTRS